MLWGLLARQLQAAIFPTNGNCGGAGFGMMGVNSTEGDMMNDLMNRLEKGIRIKADEIIETRERQGSKGNADLICAALARWGLSDAKFLILLRESEE